MSYLEDENGKYIDRGGLTSAQSEAAGINYFDNADDVARKTEDYKNRELRIRLHGEEFPSHATSARPGVEMKGRWLVFVFSFLCVPMILFFCFSKITELLDSSYLNEDSAIPVIRRLAPPSSQLTSLEKIEFRTHQFKETYGVLFDGNAPMTVLYGACDMNKRACAAGFFDRLESLRPFANNPATMLESMCDDNAKDFYGGIHNYAVEAKWQIEFLKTNGTKIPFCKLGNAKEYVTSVQKRIYAISALYFIAGIIVSIVTVFVFGKIFCRMHAS